MVVSRTVPSGTQRSPRTSSAAPGGETTAVSQPDGRGDEVVVTPKASPAPLPSGAGSPAGGGVAVAPDSGPMTRATTTTSATRNTSPTTVGSHRETSP